MTPTFNEGRALSGNPPKRADEFKVPADDHGKRALAYQIESLTCALAGKERKQMSPDSLLALVWLRIQVERLTYTMEY